MEESRKNLVVFDLDETLVSAQPSVVVRGGDADAPKETGMVIHFRPQLDKLFDFLKNAKANNRLDVAIWTFGNRPYAESIKVQLMKTYNLRSDFFTFVFSREDQPPNVHSKSMVHIKNMMATKNKKYDHCILVDNLVDNVKHVDNKNCSIHVSDFVHSSPNSKDDTELLSVIVKLQKMCGMNLTKQPKQTTRIKGRQRGLSRKRQRRQQGTFRRFHRLGLV